MDRNLALRLKMQDAKIFRRGLKDTHRMLMADGGAVRRDSVPGSWVDCPWDTLPYNSVANMLHVLAGERPVPTFRKSDMDYAPKRIPLLDDIAMGARVHISTGVQETAEGVLPIYGKYNGETMMTRKGWSESRYPVEADISFDKGLSVSTQNLFSWDKFRAHAKDEVFFQWMGLINEILGHECFTGPVTKALEDLHGRVRESEELRARANALVEATKLKSPWRDLILTGSTRNLTSLRSGFGSMEAMFNFSVVRGKDSVIIRDGEIWVPVTQEESLLFRNGCGFATILEGGLVTIEGVDDLHQEYFDDMKPVFVPEAVDVAAN